MDSSIGSRTRLGKTLGSGTTLYPGEVTVEGHSPAGELATGGNVASDGTNPSGDIAGTDSLSTLATKAGHTAGAVAEITVDELAKVLKPAENIVSGSAPTGEGQGDNKFDNTNPKQEILTLGKGTFEIAQPMFLASWQHGYAVGPSDHQLFLTINPEWQHDLVHCPA
eukprot:COSAG01_NODE_22557_length_850_cov_2.299601_2_plen_166_part_01